MFTILFIIVGLRAATGPYMTGAETVSIMAGCILSGLMMDAIFFGCLYCQYMNSLPR